MKHVLLDCDGVVTNLVKGTHVKMSAVYRALSMTPPSIRDLTDYTMKSLYAPELHSIVDLIWSQPGFARHLPFTTFGTKLRNSLSPFYQSHYGETPPNFTFEFVTAPYHSPTWIQDRTEGLNWAFNHPKINFAHDKSNFDGDVFVEDHPKNLVAWKLKHPDGEGYLVHTSYMDSLFNEEFVRLFGEGKTILPKLRIKIVPISKLYSILNR